MCGSQQLGLVLHKSRHLELEAFIDADWATNPDDRRSTRGICVFFGHSLVSWKSGKQRVLLRSSTKFEFRALATTITEVMWIQKLLVLCIDISKASLVFCDNVNARFVAKNLILYSRTKHVDIDFHLIRENFLTKEISVEYTPS